MRHGESTWNRENRFTGWMDVPLSDKGVSEATEAGKYGQRAVVLKKIPLTVYSNRLLLKEGYTFDVAYTSVLQVCRIHDS